jgi:hypothetical protein
MRDQHAKGPWPREAADRLESLGFKSGGGYSDAAIAEVQSKNSERFPEDDRQFLRELGDWERGQVAIAVADLSLWGRTMWVADFRTDDPLRYGLDGYVTIGTAVNPELGWHYSDPTVGAGRILLKCTQPDAGSICFHDVWSEYHSIWLLCQLSRLSGGLPRREMSLESTTDRLHQCRNDGVRVDPELTQKLRGDPTRPRLPAHLE